MNNEIKIPWYDKSKLSRKKYLKLRKKARKDGINPDFLFASHGITLIFASNFT